jgi:N-acetylneuraminic acid mutarotase
MNGQILKFALVGLFLTGATLPANISEWTWLAGSDVRNQPGIYGIQGTPDVNNIPGGRHSVISWTDSQGTFWLFGGYGYATSTTIGWLNDIWKYDQGSGAWTWVGGPESLNDYGSYGVQGVTDSNSFPGARRNAVCWVGEDDVVWLFGGDGFDEDEDRGTLNDLWKFEPDTLDWTWIKGANVIEQPGIYGSKGVADDLNTPGARNGAVSWTDSAGKLWLFGGNGHDINDNTLPLNDLWMFDPVSENWTWVNGSDTGHQPGVYGTQGVGVPSNVPGSRTLPVAWTDGGALVLFGGYGQDENDDTGTLSDLWSFDQISGNWTWLKGGKTGDLAGVYGTQDVADPLNLPGARHSSFSWVDLSGTPWLLGGYGADQNGDAGNLNDLWRYDPGSRNWTWVKGATIKNQKGTYGTQGVAASSNVPGAEYAGASWTDENGFFFTFGGNGLDGNGSIGFLNHLWSFDPLATITFQADGTSGAFLTGQNPQYVYSGGDSTPVTANAPTGFNFEKWTDGGVDFSTANPITLVNPTEDMALTAHYLLKTYTLTYIAGGKGSVTGPNPQSVFHNGNGDTVTAVPDQDYYFDRWSDGLTTAERTDMAVTSDITVTAFFVDYPTSSVDDWMILGE